VKTPHLLLAGTNCHKIRSNLTHILDVAAIEAITAEIRLNAAGLFSLGNEHFQFAKGCLSQNGGSAFHAITMALITPLEASALYPMAHIQQKQRTIRKSKTSQMIFPPEIHTLINFGF
jgi:hypothetical protein